MARAGTASRRYAEAAFELATARGESADVADRWRDELDAAAAVTGDDRVTRVLENPALPWPERDEVLRKLLEGRISAPAFNLVRLLARRGRIDLLAGVAAEYRRLLGRSRGVATATVTAARDLSDDDLDAIRERVQAMTGGEVDLEVRVDPSLIGGVTVRIGDKLIDASVRGRLERLRARVAAGAG
jgi:F-type H+-transporting ATPase subunit delta